MTKNGSAPGLHESVTPYAVLRYEYRQDSAGAENGGDHGLFVQLAKPLLYDFVLGGF
jgi:hypothetical protein